MPSFSSQTLMTIEPTSLRLSQCLLLCKASRTFYGRKLHFTHFHIWASLWRLVYFLCEGHGRGRKRSFLRRRLCLSADSDFGFLWVTFCTTAVGQPSEEGRSLGLLQGKQTVRYVNVKSLLVGGFQIEFRFVVYLHTRRLPPGAFLRVLIQSSMVIRRMDEEWGDFLEVVFVTINLVESIL